jgi:hypothetical protein
LENGSSNHGEPFFLTASPRPSPGEREKERKSIMKL